MSKILAFIVAVIFMGAFAGLWSLGMIIYYFTDHKGQQHGCASEQTAKLMAEQNYLEPDDVKEVDISDFHGHLHSDKTTL